MWGEGYVQRIWIPTNKQTNIIKLSGKNKIGDDSLLQFFSIPRVFTATMEATTAAEGLLDQIRPPRLEDAGLEDCALPPDSIKEAFLKAATAVGSRAASIFEKDEGRCVEVPWGEKTGDDLVGVIEGVDPPPGACVVEKGSGVGEAEERGDKLVAPGLTEAEERGDKVVEGGEACVDGLKGLEIGNKGKSGGVEEEGERPILGETFV